VNSQIEAQVRMLLQTELDCTPSDSNVIVDLMRMQARKSGYELDARFAHAGLGAGPEARIASRIVNRAMFGGGDETAEYSIEAAVRDWLRMGTSGRRR
jgi:hypothetical protein